MFLRSKVCPVCTRNTGSDMTVRPIGHWNARGTSSMKRRRHLRSAEEQEALPPSPSECAAFCGKRKLNVSINCSRSRVPLAGIDPGGTRALIDTPIRTRRWCAQRGGIGSWRCTCWEHTSCPSVCSQPATSQLRKSGERTLLLRGDEAKRLLLLRVHTHVGEKKRKLKIMGILAFMPQRAIIWTNVALRRV